MLLDTLSAAQRQHNFNFEPTSSLQQQSSCLAAGVCFYQRESLPGYSAIFRHPNDELNYCYYLIPCGKDGMCGDVTARPPGPQEPLTLKILIIDCAGPFSCKNKTLQLYNILRPGSRTG